jgi:glycosyltransferase involved in cell wall biosynthesis
VTRATVCHIITKLELGGAQQNTLFTVAHLDRSRFRPVLISGERGLLDDEAAGLLGEDWRRVPSLVRPINPAADLRAFLSIRNVLRQIRPMIVHTHSSKAGILGRLAARSVGVPIVVHTIHGFGVTPAQHPMTRWALLGAERVASRATDRFFAVSQANRQQGIRQNLFRADQCRVIRSGVDLRALRELSLDVGAKKRSLGFAPDQSIIGMVGPLKPQKAPLDFLRMAASVRRSRPDVAFLYIGDGELKTAFEAEVARLHLTSSCKLLGWRRDVPELLRCLDVFVLTSLWEGLPRVYLEALASGIPVVGTRVDGAAEVIRDGYNGYLLAPHDWEGLARRVLYLLSAPEIRASMGARGRQGLSPDFDIYEMVRRQEREYDELLAAGTGSAGPVIRLQGAA